MAVNQVDLHQAGLMLLEILASVLKRARMKEWYGQDLVSVLVLKVPFELQNYHSAWIELEISKEDSRHLLVRYLEFAWFEAERKRGSDSDYPHLLRTSAPADSVPASRGWETGLRYHFKVWVNGGDQCSVVKHILCTEMVLGFIFSVFTMQPYQHQLCALIFLAELEQIL